MAKLSGMLSAIDPVWIIEPARGRALLQALDGIDLGEHLASYKPPPNPKLYWDDEGGWDDVDDDQPYQVDANGVARIDIIGVMTKRPQSFGRGTSTILLRKALRAAARDEDVKGILLVADSPGGQADGTADLAADIRLISGQKPVMGYAEDCCCSAALWAASQCGAGLYCGRDATVGSVGAMTEIDDSSELYKKAGIKVYVIASGELKAAFGCDGVPVTDTNLATASAYVMARAANFQEDVRTGLGLMPKRMTEISRAGVYVGAAAAKMKLVDGVCTLDEAYRMLVNSLPGGTSAALPASEPNADRTDEEADDNDDLDEPDGDPDDERDTDARKRARVAAMGGMPQPDSSRNPVTVPPLPSRPAATERKPMKETMIRLLNTFGLRSLAMAVFSEKDESPEAIVGAMAANVDAQVAEKVKQHPLIAGLEAAGVKDVEGLKALLKMSAFGDTALGELRAEAKAQAIRLYGSENGPRISGQVSSMEPAEVKAIAAAWRAEGDAKFGHGADGSAPQRISASGPLREAAPATGEADKKDKAPRERLTAVQLAYAGKLGYKTEAELDAFAQRVLDGEAEKRAAAAA